MKSFPVFRRLRVHDFGLYPGREGEKGLHIDFHPGLTLAVGANGLGKTTLTTLLFRMLSGPNDIPQLSAGADLGFRRLETRPLRPHQRKTFAARVSDGATTATAYLELTLGSNSVSVERRLCDLALKNAQIAGVACASESRFQSLVAKAAGLGSFGDFILVLRYLVFYFEDRRQLVWDPSAQRQLLRILFLPPDLAQSWTAQERSILENDSRMRNFQAVLGREEGLLTQSLEKKSSAPDLRAELEMLEKLQEPDRLRLGKLECLTSDLDRVRQNARRAHLQAKQEREVRLRAVEHARFLTIDARFPTPEEAGRYVLAHLLSENRCLACGEQATQSARQYAARLTSNRCVVCDRPLPMSDQIVESREVADRRLSLAQEKLKSADGQLSASTREREVAEHAFVEHIREMAELRSSIATRSARLEEIVASLPPSEAALRKQRADLASLRGRLETMKSDLAKERVAFKSFVEQCTDALLSSSDTIVRVFSQFASSFLSERVNLTWSPRAANVGQGGESIPFPAFELNMSGSDFVQLVRRTGPGDVSESQREFIDLSFRMALMHAAGSSDASLVVDAPESSLDAVFAKRAGKTIIGFSTQGSGTVLVTTNLIEGNLLPTLVDGIAATPEGGSRLVDLFEIARPTAAVVAESAAYDDLRRRAFGHLL